DKPPLTSSQSLPVFRSGSLRSRIPVERKNVFSGSDSIPGEAPDHRAGGKRSKARFQLLFQTCERHGAAQPVAFPAVLEQDQGRQTRYAETVCESGFLFGIHFYDFEPPFPIPGKLLEHGTRHM